MSAGERDRGAVTVEAAIGIGAIVTVFALVLAGMAVIIGQLRCTDAAIEAARLLARGDRQRAVDAVSRIAPQGARLEVRIEGDQVTTMVHAPSPAGAVLGHALSSQASAVLEPGAVVEAVP